MPTAPTSVLGPQPTGSSNGMLLGPGFDLGPDMTIDAFCRTYGLHQSIFEKLDKNGYDHARNLRFVSLDNLAEIGFKLGQKALIQDAVERWAVHHT